MGCCCDKDPEEVFKEDKPDDDDLAPIWAQLEWRNTLRSNDLAMDQDNMDKEKGMIREGEEVLGQRERILLANQDLFNEQKCEEVGRLEERERILIINQDKFEEEGLLGERNISEKRTEEEGRLSERERILVTKQDEFDEKRTQEEELFCEREMILEAKQNLFDVKRIEDEERLAERERVLDTKCDEFQEKRRLATREN